MTCFRVCDWVTRLIRGAGWELCWRRDFFRHSRPVTPQIPQIERLLKNLITHHGGRVRTALRSGARRRDTGSVSLVDHAVCARCSMPFTYNSVI